MSRAERQKATILLVDDTPENLRLLIDFLKESGFKTPVVTSGEWALQYVERIRPDLILLDVLMPGIDGFETCHRLKEQAAIKAIPIIFMTGLAETVDKVKGFQAGGVDYITKPFQCEEVLQRIITHLTLREFQQQLQEQNERLRHQNIELDEQKTRLQRLAEATFEGIVMFDEDRIFDINETMATMFGWQHAELIGKNTLDLIAPAGHDAVSNHIRAGNEAPYETEGIKKDKSPFPIEIQTKTMPYQGREIRVAAIRDLSWRKRVEKEREQLQHENITLKSTIKERYKFGEIIGRSPAMQQVYELIVKAAASDENIIIYGESGTGKELVAQTIHRLSKRKIFAFVPVNCGAIVETLFEREFFGHRKGAFTGATASQSGFFDAAHSGSLFLDEVGELSPAMQVKLLRALEYGEYTPVGSHTPQKADVRIIAATNKNLKELRMQGLVREDFFYRIHVIEITVPPLRTRKEDIPLLIEYFLERSRPGQKSPRLPANIIETLCNYDWPGNIRELQNKLQQYLSIQRLDISPDRQITPGGIPDYSEETAVEALQKEEGLHAAVEELEKRMIAALLEQTHWHRGKTAERLGIPRKTLQRKMKKYGFQ